MSQEREPVPDTDCMQGHEPETAYSRDLDQNKNKSIFNFGEDLSSVPTSNMLAYNCL